MDSDTNGIVIRTRMRERHDEAARERLVRTAPASTSARPGWRERLGLILHRPMTTADIQGR